MRYRDERGDDWADIIDMLTMHPEWLATLLHARGVEATAEALRLLPYDVEFSERLRARLEAEA